MSYCGGCRCGAVLFTVVDDLPARAISCNCSMCHQSGFLFTYVSADRLTLHAGHRHLGVYRLNDSVIEHQFCTICGTEPFGMGVHGGETVWAVNLHCVPTCDIAKLEVERERRLAFRHRVVAPVLDRPNAA